MMEKLLHFAGKVGDTIFTQPIRPGRGAFAKLAGAPVLCDEVQQFVDRLQPHPNYTYVLNNALGAFEYYGSNVNGDSFPMEGLLNGHSLITSIPAWDIDARIAAAKTLKHGYPTFYTSCIYQHHVNKDPSKTLGRIELAAWNSQMKRVEVVFALDHDRCRAQGAWGLIERILSGDYPPTSMGCRVPHDRCSICGNLAKTRHEYCEHVNNLNPLYGMNRILADGRVCCVHNDTPFFFDDSFVVIGADKTAWMMAKLASGGKKYWVFSIEGTKLSSAERGELYYGGREKVASVGIAQAPAPKTMSTLDKVDEEVQAEQIKAAARKFADMLKALPSGPSSIIRRLESREPDLPRESIEALAPMGLGGALAATARCGMVLKPREYQRLALHCHGAPDMAESYYAAGHQFRPGPPMMGNPISWGSQHPGMGAAIRALLPMLMSRSAFAPIIEHRITLLAMPVDLPAHPPLMKMAGAEDPGFAALSKGYSCYRYHLANSLEKVAESHPLVRQTIEDRFLLDEYTTVKQGSASAALKLLALIGPIVYLRAAHLRSRKEAGEALGTVESLIANHPSVVTALAMGTGMKLLKNRAAARAATQTLL